MPKYLCIFRTKSGKCEAPSPEQMEGMYAKFNAWKEKFSDNIVDMGGKLSGDSAVLTSDGVNDGPFVETKEIVGGFMVIQADDLEEAFEVVRESPGSPRPGSSVEVRELQAQ